MNSDLISRKALKKAIKDEFDLAIRNGNIMLMSKKGIVDRILAYIDNAPTVFSCNTCKNMGNERECIDCHDYSNYVHYDERPQGKWVVNSNGTTNFYACDKCGSAGDIQDKFCRECEAAMRGEK